jgi:tRNA pseudouridine55 synthase
MVAYHEGHDKEYAVTVRLGVRTETDDAAGRVLEERDASGVTREAVEAMLPRFTGTIRQRPPAFSAVKIDGERARSAGGESVELWSVRSRTWAGAVRVAPREARPDRRGRTSDPSRATSRRAELRRSVLVEAACGQPSGRKGRAT